MMVTGFSFMESASAVPGNLLLELNNPTPEIGDFFGVSVASTPNGNILVGAAHDNAATTDAGSAYLFNSSFSSTQTIEQRLVC